MLRLLVTFLCVTPLAGLLQEGDCLDVTSTAKSAALGKLDRESGSRQLVANASSQRPSGSRSFDSSFMNLLGGGMGAAGGKTVLDQLIRPFGDERAPPKQPATTSTTTTAAPLRELGDNLKTLSGELMGAPINMINTPLKVINGLTKASSNEINRATESIAKPATLKDLADESKYYEYTVSMEPWTYRRPKYFSRECPFRFACEVGKMTKPFTQQISSMVETNKFIQDLQNRYTRAMTYGSLFGDCERYYCVLVKLLGGPVGFASGVAEIVNGLMNRDIEEAESLPTLRA